jgi:hypothetical protein
MVLAEWHHSVHCGKHNGRQSCYVDQCCQLMQRILHTVSPSQTALLITCIDLAVDKLNVSKCFVRSTFFASVFFPYGGASVFRVISAGNVCVLKVFVISR